MQKTTSESPTSTKTGLKSSIMESLLLPKTPDLAASKPPAIIPFE
jgi:hypothetical protein